MTRNFFLELDQELFVSYPDPLQKWKKQINNKKFTFFCFNCSEKTVECSPLQKAAVALLFFFIDYNKSFRITTLDKREKISWFLKKKLDTFFPKNSTKFVSYLTPITRHENLHLQREHTVVILGDIIIITIYAPVNITALCIIFSGGQIHYEGG